MAFYSPIPILRSFDKSLAKEFYIEFLSFAENWSHEPDDESPIYMQISKGKCVLHLTEHFGDAAPGMTLRIPVDDLNAFHSELISKRYKNARPGLNEMPWGMEMPISDPFGNRLIFFQAPSGSE